MPPKSKRQRRRTPVKKLKISEVSDLGALGAGSIFAEDYDDSVSEKMFLLSIEATFALGEHTPDQGPITFGVAHSDYTSAEITEWFAATNNWDTGNKVAQEFARRKIRQVGTFSGALAQEVLNDGRPIKTRLRFGLESGQTLQTWAINEDTSTLTTGTRISTNGQIWAKSA